MEGHHILRHGHVLRQEQDTLGQALDQTPLTPCDVLGQARSGRAGPERNGTERASAWTSPLHGGGISEEHCTTQMGFQWESHGKIWNNNNSLSTGVYEAGTLF